MMLRRPIAIHKNQPIVEGDLSRGADATIEIVEIGAAAERDMLAVVDVLAGGQDVGGGAAAQKGPLFEQTNAEAGVSQRDGRGKPRQAAADHDHALRGHPPPTTTQSRAKQNARFFRGASGGRARKIRRNRDLRSAPAAAVNPRQRPKRGAAIAMQSRNQARALGIESPGAVGFAAQQFAHARA